MVTHYGQDKIGNKSLFLKKNAKILSKQKCFFNFLAKPKMDYYQEKNYVLFGV